MQCFKTQSNVFPQHHRPSVTPTFMKILCKCQHMFIFQLSSYQKTKDSKTSKRYERILNIAPNQFPLIFLILQSLFLNATLKKLQVPHPSKISNNVSGRSLFLRCDIPTVPLEYIIRTGMWPLNVQLHCSNYKWQLHVSAKKQPTGCLCEKYKRKPYTCSLHIDNNDQQKISQPNI